MSLNNLNAILCFVLAVVSFGYVSAEICGDSLFFKPNGTYDTNRRLVLSTLASDVSSNDGFYTVTVGEGPERIYAIGMCVPGSEPHICSSCIKAASDWILTHCPNQTDSFDWSPQKTLCYIRYSNSSFYNKTDLEPSQAEYYTGDIPGNVTEFNRIWEDVMQRMIVAASSSTHGSPARTHYVASITPLPGFGFLNMYALMQCIPGISSEDCEKCLLENVRTQQQCCSKNKGGSVRRPVCVSRSDTSPFYGAFDNLKWSPPPQTPQTMPPPGDLPQSTKKGGKNFPIVGIVVPAIILPLLILGFVVYCKMMKKKKKRNSYKPMKLESKFRPNPQSSSPEAKANADLLNRTFTNSPMDGKVKPPNIQVFINFRGDQLRNNFIGHLLNALRRSEINVFIDNQEQRGEDLNTLFTRIEESGIAIVVFSSRYTESEWCLNELMKIKERVQQGLLKVLPIFYKVGPGNVKKLKGEFGDNFRDKEHKYESDKPKIERWKEAIVFVSHKFALTFDEKSGVLEIDFIEIIVKEVLKMLQPISTVESGQSSRVPLP